VSAAPVCPRCGAVLSLRSADHGFKLLEGGRLIPYRFFRWTCWVTSSCPAFSADIRSEEAMK
jgi:hypothetical protein